MKLFAFTQAGPGKAENEDRIVINQTILSGGLIQADYSNGIIGIADGVGGNNAGAVAAHFVASELTKLRTVTNEALTQINIRLIEQSKTNALWYNMATTLSGIIVSADKKQIFHVGNTRVYHMLSGKYLKQLTEDDTTLNYLLSSGQLSPDKVKSFERKNEITACFGGGNPSLLNLKFYDASNLAYVVMTSDGIHDYLSTDEMEDILSQNSDFSEKCCAVAQAARNRGSTDDASILVGVL